MRSICLIILIISSTSVFASDESNTIIWFDGPSYYEILNAKEQVTLYFNSWDDAIPRLLNNEQFKIAYKLDRSLDPLPHDNLELPPIEYISAVDDDSLVYAYLDFLENYSRSKGFNYLILPDTADCSSYEIDVLKAANQKSPYFFIDQSNLSSILPQSKKELTGFEAPIWIANQRDDIGRLAKLNRKATRGPYRTFYRGLQAYQQRAFHPVDQVPESISEALFAKGAVAIDDHNVFPLGEEAIVYLGNDEKLRQRIGQYVKVYDKPQIENYPVIVDNRESERRLYGNEIVIDYLDSYHPGGYASLLLAGSIAHDDILIAKMLFGSQEIPGHIDHFGNRQLRSFDYLSRSDLNYEGLSDSLVFKVDSLATHAIQQYAVPGCQVVVVKNGAIVFQEAYGHFTYDSLKELTNETIFDIASVTKVAATLPSIALLIDQGKISLDDTLGQFLPNFAGSNKGGISIKQLLAHQSGVLPYVPFWRMALDGDRLDAFYYKSEEDEANDIRTYGLAPHPALKDSLTSWIIRSRLSQEPNQYHYSDIGFMILHLVVETVSGQPFDEFLTENFYAPMGIDLIYNPFEKGYAYEDIAPTEYDERYRSGQIWGEVHDRNAHIFGGVAGHAGLFANALDLARLMYMFSNGGYYGGRQYLSKDVLHAFNLRYFEDNRRGLGWDKKDWEKDSASPAASDESFGHTGFTGTMVWADPREDLVFVFLSNRIYPTANNINLLRLNTRTEIHDAIYQSLTSE